MGDVILHGFAPSTYVRTCRMALHEKEVAYQLNSAMPQSDEQLARQPWGKVPALTHGDVELYETLVITRYIDEAFSGSTLQPDDVVERARMCQWMSVMMAYLYRPLIRDIVIQRLVVPSQGGSPDEAVIVAAIPEVEKVLAIYDQALSEASYLAGNTLSLADLYLLPLINYLALTPEAEGLLGKTDHLTRWQQEMEARAGIAEVLQAA